jgi:hypothetical protein
MFFFKKKKPKETAAIAGLRERRAESRLDHTRAVLIVPDHDGKPSLAGAVFGLTGDISHHGLSAYLAQPFESGPVFVGLWFEGRAQIYRGRVRGSATLAGSSCRVSFELLDIATPDTPGMSALLELASKLREPCGV